MAKRNANGYVKSSSTDKKFEIDAGINLVVSLYNNQILIHIRKYDGDRPSKEGVWFHADQFDTLLNLLEKEKGTHIAGQVRVKRTKLTAHIERVDKDKSILLRSCAIKTLQSRVPFIREAVNYFIGKVAEVETVSEADAIDEVKDIIIALLPRMQHVLLKRRCDGCALNDLSQLHHTCLEADEDVKKEMTSVSLSMCTDQLINAILGANGRQAITVEVETVKNIQATAIAESVEKGDRGTVAAEQLVQNFLSLAQHFFIA